MLWRLLRIGSAPYFVLGASPQGLHAVPHRDTVGLAPALRAPRRSTSRRAPAGNRWSTGTRSCGAASEPDARNLLVGGHVEVRWSHGRFCGPPEAKVYLDTPHAEVPGYFPLD